MSTIPVMWDTTVSVWDSVGRNEVYVNVIDWHYKFVTFFDPNTDKVVERSFDKLDFVRITIDFQKRKYDHLEDVSIRVWSKRDDKALDVGVIDWKEGIVMGWDDKDKQHERMPAVLARFSDIEDILIQEAE